VAAAIALGTTPLAVDERGVPRLLRAGASMARSTEKTATAAALDYAKQLAPAWGVKQPPQLVGLGEVSVRGGTIVRLRQTIDGMPVDAGELRVFVRPDRSLIAASGVMVGADTQRTLAKYLDDDAGAVARAVGHQLGASFDRGKLVATRTTSDGSRVLSGRAGTTNVEMARARKVWHHDGGQLVAAWEVEAYAGSATTTSSDAFRVVLAAADGRVLQKRSLVDDAAFTYRVFAETTGELHPFDGPTADPTPHPTGHPDGTYPALVTSNLVTVDGLNHPGGSATPDPWLVAGRTETLGNNVECYADFNAPDGLTFGDFRATITAASTFDRTYDFTAQPLATQTQQMAGITSLFYTMNWLHDFWYDAGFTETAGNGQNDNFGRGGEDRDAILGEAQDNALGGSRNNANMSTPADGLPPRMQVFLWTGHVEKSLTLPARSPAVGTAVFGPQSFDVTGDLIVADDGTAPDNTDACQPVTNNVTGKIVVITRGTCSFKSKVARAQAAGAAAVILANNAANSGQTTPPGLGDDPATTTVITIGTISLTTAEGDQLKADIAAGAVTATIHRLTGVEQEGTLDASVIAHEFGHYLHHRLTTCGNNWCRAMSEGWGDFDTLLVTTRPGDNLDGAYPMGVFSTISFSSDPAYFGIRRAPYSVDQTINSLAYHHMSDGAALPTTHPFLVFGANSEVHNAGEIWAETMWEVYVALQKAGAAATPPVTFEDTRKKMQQYVVAQLLMQPTEATPTESRDALLTAILATSQADHDTVANAFARRGMGTCAVTPARESTTFVGITDSSELKGRTVPGAVVATDSVQTCDHDGVLDGGETASVTFPISNPGPVALTDVQVTLTSTTTGVTVTSAPVTIASLAPYGSSDVTMEVKLDDTVSEPIAGDFTITIAAAGACEPTVTVPLALRLNVDDKLEAATTDTFDTVATVWTAATDGVQSFKQVRETALDGAWHGDDQGVKSDTSLTSPMLTADATTPVTVTYTHKFAFEADATNKFDGGVVEIAVDGGAFQDVTALGANPGYNGTLATTSGNPLGGRMAYTATNASTPNTDNVTLDFGTQLAGKTFQLRFRIATDAGAGAPGWDIDDVAFTGIIGSPFPAQVTDTGSCTNPMPPDGNPGTPDGGTEPPPPEDNGCCDAGPLRTSNALLVGVVLGLVLRRRRRR
jgi:fungalysin metallopeptidase (M36)/PA domain-containing protein